MRSAQNLDLLHVPCDIQAHRLLTTGDVLDDSVSICKRGRMVRTHCGCVPTHLRVLEPGACKMYQLPSFWRLDQPAAYCERSCNPDLAAPSPVENANDAREENGLERYLPHRIHVSTRSPTEISRRLIIPYSGIVGACIRLALYIHRFYVQQPGSNQTTSK